MKSEKRHELKRILRMLLGIIVCISGVALYFAVPKYESRYDNWFEFVSGSSRLSCPNEEIATRESSRMLSCRCKRIYINGFIANELSDEEFEKSIEQYIKEYTELNSLCLSNKSYVDEREYAYLPSDSIEELIKKYDISINYMDKLTDDSQWRDYSILLYEYYKNYSETVFNIVLYNENNKSIIHVASNNRYNPLGNW